MTSKLLSLCIPTFNRAKFLEISVTAILTTIAPHFRKDIQIVISDNVSEDNTQSVLQKFQTENSDIEWIVVRQEKSVGFSNITLVTKYATGEFIWILSDDDIIMPEAINRIIQMLRYEPMNGIVANYASFLNDIQFINKPVLPKVQNLKHPSDIVAFLSSQLTFLSILVFRRSLTQLPVGEKWLSALCQCYMFLDVIAQGEIKYIPTISLAVRGENSGNYNFFQIFIEQFDQVLHYAEALGLDQSALHQARVKHLPFLMNLAFVSRSQSDPNRDWTAEKELFRKYYPNYLLSLVTIFILSIPNFLFFPIAKFLNSLGK